MPIIFDSEHIFQQGVSSVSKYSNYSIDESGDYDLTIIAVTADFFRKMEIAVNQGLYKKYDEKDENGEIGICTRKAWEKVWLEQKLGDIKRVFLPKIMRALFRVNIRKMENPIVVYILPLNRIKNKIIDMI